MKSIPILFMALSLVPFLNGCGEATYDMNDSDSSLVDMAKSTNVKPTQIRYVIGVIYSDPIDAHGKTLHQVTEDFRKSTLELSEKALQSARNRLTRYGGEEIWASSFYVEDLLGALPNPSDAIKLKDPKDGGFGKIVTIEYSFPNCKEIGAISVSETDSSKKIMISNGSRSPFGEFKAGKLRGLRCDNEWVDIPRYATDYTRSNKERYTDNYNDILVMIDRLKSAKDLSEIQNLWSDRY